MFSVYCHTNKKNGMRYIGITAQDPKARWLNGKGYSRNQKFYTAIKKYGWENFMHEILSDGLTEDEAVSLEKKLIEEYDSVKHGYNNSWGGKYVPKRALCHEANMIKKGLKSCRIKAIAEWAELFENAEKEGADSWLCRNLNHACEDIIANYKRDKAWIRYDDPVWLVEFINALRDASDFYANN